MKRKQLVFLLFSLICLSLSAFAETGIFYLEKTGDYQIFATVCETIPPPRGPVVKVYRNIGVMDKDGNTVVQPFYHSIRPLREGRSLFSVDNGRNVGFFDENWNVIVEPKYKSACDFYEGLAVVVDENWRYGYIDKDGNTVIPHIYDMALSFENGLATVGITDNGYHFNRFTREGKIDREGNIVEPIKYTWDDEYEVRMSSNNINIRGTVYKNSDLEYPFINYLGYTYIPMSFYTCSHLGLATTWTPSDGLSITALGSIPMVEGKYNVFEKVLGKNDMVPEKTFKAQLYKGSITINGKTYTADDVYYPLLTYRDVVYIPVLWKQGMEEMNIDYSYDLESTSLVFKSIK